MEAHHLLARAFSRCTLIPGAAARPSSLSSVLVIPTRRHKSTASRTKKALNIPPHPSFLTSNATSEDTIIFNPPSSAASVYHTPFRFLPKSDPRRRANLNALFASSTTLSFDPNTTGVSTATTSSETDLPPAIEHRKYTETKYHLTRDDVAKIRALRAEDPATHTVTALAAKFDCSPFFIMKLVQASPEHIDEQRKKLEKTKKRWGGIRTRAREDRKKRWDLLFKGEI